MENKKKLIAAALAGVFFLNACGSSEENLSGKTGRKGNRDVISDFTLVETEKGRKSWILEASRVALKKSEEGIDIIEVNEFDVLFFEEDDEITLEAGTGHYNRLNNRIYTRGEVIISSDKKKIITSDVRWEPGSRKFITGEKVEIHTPEGVIRGVGMVASTDLSDIKLTREIKGEFSN
ncbi:MAG: LPS export ABC transporter periplasmic protein LptC [Elusimicrobiota bacterium]|nr:LPS export ABC transporter periplasmic protein LptC [Elusimicrobiota bacterium]